MNHLELSSLLDASCRRRLTPAEAAALRAALASNPPALAQWEVDSALTRVLDQLPPAPVPSNFTTRVLESIDRAGPRPVGGSLWTALAGLLLRPRWATAAVLVALLPVAYWQYETRSRDQLATSVASFGQSVREAGRTTPLPLVDLLRDFDAIDSLRRANAAADVELLASLETGETR